MGRKCFSMLTIPTFRGVFLKYAICLAQLKWSSMSIPKNVVKFTCFISFPLMFILTLSVLYFLPFGKNIRKFLFFYRKFVGMEPSC